MTTEQEPKWNITSYYDPEGIPYRVWCKEQDAEGRALRREFRAFSHIEADTLARYLNALERDLADAIAALEARCSWCVAKHPFHRTLNGFHSVPCAFSPCNREHLQTGNHGHQEPCRLTEEERDLLARLRKA